MARGKTNFNIDFNKENSDLKGVLFTNENSFTYQLMRVLVHSKVKINIFYIIYLKS